MTGDVLMLVRNRFASLSEAEKSGYAHFFDFTYQTITGWVAEYRKLVARTGAGAATAALHGFKVDGDMEALFVGAWAEHDAKMVRFGRNRQGDKH